MPDSLTTALLRPLRADHCPVSETAIDRLAEELNQVAAHSPGGGPFRLTDFAVRAALCPADAVGDQTPFAWSAGTARRALGLAAVRSLTAGTTRSPVEGVTLAIGDAVGGVRQGKRPASSMDRWLAGLSAAGIAAVQADAVTWATRLWTALEWSHFATPPVIGRDHWWDSPQSSLLALRSRAEVRGTTTDGRGNPVSAHLVVLGGSRRASVRSELSVVALVEALRTREPLPPGRIVGWWPDSGRFLAVDVDQITLSEGVATVARTLAWLARAGGVAGTAA